MKTLFFAMAAVMLTLGVSCSDSDEGASTGKKVGDYYNRGSVVGIVYKITDGGKHGMIVSLDEHAGLEWTKLQFENVGDDVVDTGARDRYDGRKNMAVIREQPDWEQKYPAFKWCSDLNENGDDGWYLPAYNELRELYDSFNGGGSEANRPGRISTNACGTMAERLFRNNSIGRLRSATSSVQTTCASPMETATSTVIS